MPPALSRVRCWVTQVVEACLKCGALRSTAASASAGGNADGSALRNPALARVQQAEDAGGCGGGEVVLSTRDSICEGHE